MKAMAAVLAIAFALFTAIASTRGDPQRGRVVFEKTCTGCHALDRIKGGPPLRKIYGQPGGRYSQFSYSEAMKAASVTWDEQTLDKWLTDTETVIPGNDMSFRLDNADQRADIIAYLRQLSRR